MTTSAENTLTIVAGTEADHDFDYPVQAKIEVSAWLAKEILDLQALVLKHGLYKVEKFDYSVDFFSTSIDEEEDGEDVEVVEDGDDRDPVSLQCSSLNVSSDTFWFSATEKNGTEEFRTEDQSIAEMANHFGLEAATA